MYLHIVISVVVIIETIDCATSTVQTEGVPAVCSGGENSEVKSEDVLSSCICDKYYLLWPSDKKCYREFTRGPCPEGHRFIYDTETGLATCSCPTFWARFSDGRCYEEYTQGPCQLGDIVLMDRDTGVGFCGCNTTLPMYYHAETNQCYELYSRGPCPIGHILAFNYTTVTPECKCQEGYVFHPEDGACYELNTPGPCEVMEDCSVDLGTPCFMRSMDTLQTECRCLPRNSLTDDGKCYQPYTRGPCDFGEWFIFRDGQAGGYCEEKKYCKRFDNWHWWAPDQRCYRQYTQGPCNRGKLFYLDPEAGGAGCYCRQEWEAYYWAPLNQCFEQESPGPCQEGQYFAYNTTSRQTECNCFKNHVYSPSSQSCIELFTQGPCPLGHIVVQDPVSQQLACDCGPHLPKNYWPPTRSCYPLYSQGPCRDGEQFRLLQREVVGSLEIVSDPACVVWGRT